MRYQNTQILGPDKTSVLYTMKMNFGFLSVPKPHVTIYRADTGIVVGSFNFRSMSRRIKMTIHDKPVDLSRSGWCTSAHEGTNLATTAEGGTMRFRWNMDGFFNGANMTCLDQQNKVYARFESSMWALRKDGMFEVGPFVSGILMDEVVIIGLAILEKRRRQNNDAAIGAGGSAAACSGGGC
ncbi:MAG: hypothetical protein ASARMPREDX12_003329 [Alectoria sarmentosa]|nr:MAG: hypothetical protein ASARMPREDX12_003329 [Alectoria sarmentosa]